jgi:hypothetical protein
MSWSATQAWNPATGTSGTTATASGPATADGATLVAALVAQSATAFGAVPGWDLVASVTGGTVQAAAIYVKKNAGSIAAVTFGWTGTSRYALIVGELAGGGVSPAVDGTGSTTAGAAPATGSAATTGADDAVIALVSDDTGLDTFSGPTNGFTIWQQGHVGTLHAGVSLALVYRLGVPAGTYSSSLVNSGGDPTLFTGLIAGLNASNPAGTLAAASPAASAALSAAATALSLGAQSAPAAAAMAAQSFSATLGAQAQPATPGLTAAESDPATLGAVADPAGASGGLSAGVTWTATLGVVAPGATAVLAGLSEYPATLAAASDPAGAGGSLFSAEGIDPADLAAQAGRSSGSFGATVVQTVNLAAAAARAVSGLTAAATGPVAFAAAAQPATLQFTVGGAALGTLTAVAGIAHVALRAGGSGGPIEYRVYANDGAGGPVDLTSPVATVSGLSWTSGPLGLPSDNTWLVHAYSPASGLEDLNADARVRVVLDPGGADVTARPNAPVGLSAVATAGGTLAVTWTYNPGGQGGSPTGFHVYLGTPTPSYGTPAATAPYTAPGVAYRAALAGLADGVTYQVAVRAYNATAEEANTAVASAVASAAGPSPVDDLTATLGP